MKVTSNNLHPGTNIEKAQTLEKGAGANANKAERVQKDTSSTSTVEISDEARLMSRAMEAVRNAPNYTTTERVQSIKRSVQDGSYKVDAEKIADRLIDEHLMSHFGKNSF